MVSAQERLTRTFTRSSHTYTRTERTEISKTRGGETKREVRVEESTQVGGGGRTRGERMQNEAEGFKAFRK